MAHARPCPSLSSYGRRRNHHGLHGRDGPCRAAHRDTELACHRAREVSVGRDDEGGAPGEVDQAPIAGVASRNRREEVVPVAHGGEIVVARAG